LYNCVRMPRAKGENPLAELWDAAVDWWDQTSKPLAEETYSFGGGRAGPWAPQRGGPQPNLPSGEAWEVPVKDAPYPIGPPVLPPKWAPGIPPGVDPSSGLPISPVPDVWGQGPHSGQYDDEIPPHWIPSKVKLGSRRGRWRYRCTERPWWRFSTVRSGGTHKLNKRRKRC